MNHLNALEPCEPRDDFRPVLIGGDLGSYALGREFYEAFGVKSWCVAPEPISAIARSDIFEVLHPSGLEAGNILNDLLELDRRCGGMPLVVTSNGDLNMARLAQIKADLPAHIKVSAASPAAIRTINDKEAFAALCRAHGVNTPPTQVACLAGTAAIEPWRGAFPVIVKAARSGEYAHARLAGFSKVYLLQNQAEVDKVFADLRAFGFSGDMLQQQVIMGDDTSKRLISLYIDRDGRVALNAGAQVLLEDHRPDMIGNPVASIARDYAAYGERLAQMLLEVGWRGPANFDLKVDARTGEVYTMECNPRLGRSSYYLTQSTANPMRLAVNDLLDEAVLPPSTHQRTVMYSIVPYRLVLRYLDADLADEARALKGSGLFFDLTRPPYERDRARNAIEWGVSLNYWRKYAAYYPRVSEMGI